jgi:hypothetical protein
MSPTNCTMYVISVSRRGVVDCWEFFTSTLSVVLLLLCVIGHFCLGTSPW